MILTDIIAKDFLSIGSIHLQLPRSGLMLVTGWDEDIGRANGAGKSTIFQVMAWALYGELPRDIKVEELIRRGQSSCQATVKFIIDNVQYTVTRKRPSSLELYIGNEKQKGNPKYLQACIEQFIGLSYKQFLITSYFPQRGDGSRFLKQNDAAAKDFLGTILNFNKTEAAYKKLHIELKEAEQQAAMKMGEVNAIGTSLERFKSIASMPMPSPPAKEDVIAVKSELEKLNLLQEPDTSAIDSEIEKVRAAVEKVEAAKYTSESHRRSIADKQRRIQHLQQSSTHYMTCPSCQTELLDSNGTLVEFDEEAAEQVKAQKIEQVEAEIAEIQLKLEKLSPLVEKASQFQLKLDEVKTKRINARHEFDMAMQKKSHLKTQMASFRKEAEAYQQGKLQKDKIAEQVIEAESALSLKTAELKKLEHEVLLLSAAKAVMSPQGAIAYSLDSIMSDINDEVAQYLDVFSHNTMTYKLTSGDDKAKVTHTLTKSGVDVSVGSLSGGEERGLILSVDLGLGEVIANRSGVNLPSVLMLDECFEGLDYVGKEKVIDALRDIAKDRCIIVIDHSTEFNALFDQSIKVVKKNEISSLVTAS